jgi:Tol biopolymer transport system component
MSGPTGKLYEFGSSRLDLGRRLFTREGRVVPLPPKSFELLRLLVENSGRAFSKQELIAAIWPGTFVEEANLSFQISVLRKALGGAAAPWIETVPKHGYRFTADVRVIASTGAHATGAVEALEPSSRTSVRSRWSQKIWAGAAISASVLAALSYLALARFERPAAVNERPAAIAAPLTSYQGYENVPSLSPDGSQVAFSWNGPAQDNHDIYVKLAGPGEPLHLTTDPAWEDKPAWSPDGRLIAFERHVAEGVADLIVIPALGGGAERRLRSIFGGTMSSRHQPTSMLAWTPDGKWIAFCGRPSATESHGIWLEAIDHRETRPLTESVTGADEFFSPSFSPDGRRLAFVHERTRFLGAVHVLPLSAAFVPTGPATRVTTPSSVLGLAWAPDGTGLVFSSGGHYGLTRLRRIALGPTRLAATGEPEILPFGEQATAITISKTGRLVYSAQFRDTNVWRSDLRDRPTGPIATPLVSSTYDDHAPDYSPDGRRLAFASTRTGVEEIWVSSSDGSDPKQVTFTGGPLCSNPRWSPDGHTILFNSRREGTSDLYLLRPDGGELTRLTQDSADDAEARWSRDGRWIYFASNRGGQLDVWKMPASGGEPIRMTRNGGMSAIESPDRKFLYYSKSGSPSSIWRVPIDGGEEKPVVDGLSYSTNFVAADRGLYFVAVGDASHKTSLDFFEFKTGKRTTVMAIGKPFWFGTALSPDQRSILYSIVDSAGSNLMLVDRFQ